VESTGKKTGFPLQVLGIADAIPAGFPLQSFARIGGLTYTVKADSGLVNAKHLQGRS
jgi:hypothetical protein